MTRRVSADDRLTAADAALLVGVRPETWRRYRYLGTAPAPDGYLGRTPWWREQTVLAWAATRRRPGRPRKGTT